MSNIPLVHLGHHPLSSVAVAHRRRPCLPVVVADHRRPPSTTAGRRRPPPAVVDRRPTMTTAGRRPPPPTTAGDHRPSPPPVTTVRCRHRRQPSVVARPPTTAAVDDRRQRPPAIVAAGDHRRRRLSVAGAGGGGQRRRPLVAANSGRSMAAIGRDEELKKLRSLGGAPSQGPSYAELQKELKKTQDLLSAEQKKTADQAYTLGELERHVKTLDRKISLATDRKKTAIVDLEKKNVEAWGLEQRVKELMDQLAGEKVARSDEVAKLEATLQEHQATADASRAALKEYQDAEPGRVAAMRLNYIRSLAITTTTDYLKSKGQLPDSANIPTQDYAALLSNIPRDLYDFLE
ncbi:uncharacterized protein LOC122044185 [Zingiber officinale]|uniref:uncharacterized protein LOC122044185 n=1 Tax=Zingiber officinale TaxID=94328 RepID=UPI001C4C047C|nr:uncharacterized protein LOC122044185 [Zingiber officinale]